MHELQGLAQTKKPEIKIAGFFWQNKAYYFFFTIFKTSSTIT